MSGGWPWDFSINSTVPWKDPLEQLSRSLKVLPLSLQVGHLPYKPFRCSIFSNLRKVSFLCIWARFKRRWKVKDISNQPQQKKVPVVKLLATTYLWVHYPCVYKVFRKKQRQVPNHPLRMITTLVTFYYWLDWYCLVNKNALKWWLVINPYYSYIYIYVYIIRLSVGR